MQARVFLVPAAAALALAAALYFPQAPVFSQTRSPDASLVALRVRFGLTDSAPRSWNGSLRAVNGEIVRLREWHPRPGDTVQGASWSLATRRGVNFVRRAWEEEQTSAPAPYLWVPGLLVEVQARPGTRLEFQTPQGAFTVEPGRLSAPARMLDGAVLVDRVPAAQLLSAPDGQSDFAALLGGPDLWAAWVSFRDNANEVFARRFDGHAWGPAQRITEKASDVFLAKLGRDGKGGVWAVWAAQLDGNFDLYARRFHAGAWSATQRLTEDPQPDVYHVLATDAGGNLWLVWQGFRDGRSDIFARRYNGVSWSPAERVSTSPANDWEPAVATDSTGAVYVAWDTYDAGNYDVLLRRFSSGAWSDVMPVARTPKFEAHVSLACDRGNRLWAAWNESGFEWGKDSGFLVKKEATRLYQWRALAVAVHTPSGWQEPVSDINRALPEELREYNDYPVLQADGTGRVWLFFRHRTVRFRDVHSNTPAHRAAWELFATTLEGSRWAEPVAVPFSQGRTDVRAGFALDSSGHLWAAWPTDNRDFEEFLFQRSEVYAGRLPAPAAAPAAAQLRARVTPELRVLSVSHAEERQDLRRIRDYTIQSEGKTYRIYRGDTHRHTEFSMDGNNDGTLQETYRYAMDAAELDYLMVSEHNGAAGPDLPYINHLLQQMADVLMLPRTFAPLYGYERSVSYPNGHRNVIFARRGVPTLPIPPEEAKGASGALALYAYLKRFGGIAISHTSATGMGTDWRDNDAEVEPLVEIYQGDRVSAEYEGAPKAAHRGNPGSAPGGFRPAGYVWNAWAKGYKLGVQVSSDHLSTHISYACTLATDFTREGLLDAMRRRHSYGATDNIILDYRLQTAGREYLQGDIVEAPGGFKLVVKVVGTAPIRQVDVIRNNAFIHNRQPLEREIQFAFVDNSPLAGESYYYVRVIQVDDQMAWSSPIWLRR